MSTGFKLLQAIAGCAKEYNHNDPLEWGENKTYLQMADDISDKLDQMGYCIRSLDGIVLEDDTHLNDESNLIGE